MKMRIAKAEKIEGPYCFGPWSKPWQRCSGSGYRRFLKRKLKRARRRAFKQYGEAAPTKRRAFIRGWEW